VQLKEGKFHPVTGHEGPEGEYMYSSNLSLTSALAGGEWLMLCHGHNSRYQIGPQGWSGTVRKISLPSEFDLRTVHKFGSYFLSPFHSGHSYDRKRRRRTRCFVIKCNNNTRCRPVTWCSYGPVEFTVNLIIFTL
jgi:hypothetical protein